MLIQDEETLELRETFTSLQQEVEAKTKKLKKVKDAQALHLYIKYKEESCDHKWTYSTHTHLHTQQKHSFINRRIKT